MMGKAEFLVLHVCPSSEKLDSSTPSTSSAFLQDPDWMSHLPDARDKDLRDVDWLTSGQGEADCEHLTSAGP